MRIGPKMESAVLDCGHPPDPTQGGGFAGRVRLDDGRMICGACATTREIETFLAHDEPRAFGYLARSTDGQLQITTWLGGKLATVTRANTRKVGGFGGLQRRVYFRAVDEKGRHWYGTSPGESMFARLHRAKR